MAGTKGGQIHIRPSSGVYATYRRLSYKPWYALAEFVDNSTQSYFSHRDELRAAYEAKGLQYQLRIEINYDAAAKVLRIDDNAFGMEINDFTRALVLDKPPADRRGRSEYGMGLKTAACWFGTKWTVETTEFGSDRGLRATVDVDDLATTHQDEIAYEEFPTSAQQHFTRLTIHNVLQPIRGRTLSRVREQLSSIYRDDLRSGEIQILWNLVPLQFVEPPVLEETRNGYTTRWRKPVDFVVSWERNNTVLPVNGWIALRNPGKQQDAGFVLLRRGRVIQGGPDEGYKPTEVFGQGNTYRSQRLIGELHMDDWPVTQAKDGFDWADGLEEAFIARLIEECKEYGNKAENLRTNEPKPITVNEMETTSVSFKQVISDDAFGRWVKSEIEQVSNQLHDDTAADSHSEAASVKDDQPTAGNPVSDEGEELAGAALPVSDKGEEPTAGIPVSHTVAKGSTPAAVPPPIEEIRRVSEGPVEYTLKLEETTWTLRLHWQDQLSDAHWMQIVYPHPDYIDVYLNTGHPFFVEHLNQGTTLELVHKLVIALALAEKMARMASHDGRVDPGDFRTLMNKVLRRVAELEGGQTT